MIIVTVSYTAAAIYLLIGAVFTYMAYSSKAPIAWWMAPVGVFLWPMVFLIGFLAKRSKANG